MMLTQSQELDKKSLELVYKEISIAWEFQRDAITILHNKSNWLIALNIVLITALMAIKEFESCLGLLIIFTLFISLIFAVANLWLKEIARGANLDELFNARTEQYEDLMEAICKKKKLAIEKNNSKVEKLKDCLKLSIVFLLMGNAIIFLNLLLNYYFYVT